MTPQLCKKIRFDLTEPFLLVLLCSLLLARQKLPIAVFRLESPYSCFGAPLDSRNIVQIVEHGFSPKISSESHRGITNKISFDSPKKTVRSNEKTGLYTRFAALEKLVSTIVYNDMTYYLFYYLRSFLSEIRSTK